MSTEQDGVPNMRRGSGRTKVWRSLAPRVEAVNFAQSPTTRHHHLDRQPPCSPSRIKQKTGMGDIVSEIALGGTNRGEGTKNARHPPPSSCDDCIIVRGAMPAGGLGVTGRVDAHVRREANACAYKCSKNEGRALVATHRLAEVQDPRCCGGALLARTIVVDD